MNVVGSTIYLPHFDACRGPEAETLCATLKHLWQMVSVPPYEGTMFDGVCTWVDADGHRHLRIVRTTSDPKVPGGLRPYIAVDRVMRRIELLS